MRQKKAIAPPAVQFPGGTGTPQEIGSQLALKNFTFYSTVLTVLGTIGAIALKTMAIAPICQQTSVASGPTPLENHQIGIMAEQVISR
ncbi:hypothetical protein NEA10_07765 [Phormidium yuhuli AB48]|uniref:Uncharacterized protein n=1 Tax=Phormidium yuhuli AB48 TaxID=2940671 RepID=A0ABY5AWL3_9CYAN|nr:hypothetical protein [Phormidium yuhuli]USR92604.1 hypothetical protein NEA10_07765 [Phormidium yuhuli AB48]